MGHTNTWYGTMRNNEMIPLYQINMEYLGKFTNIKSLKKSHL